MSRQKLKLAFTVVLVIIAVYFKLEDSTKLSDYTKRTEKGALVSQEDEKQGKFFVLRDCKYIAAKYNDGDSFKIKTRDGRVVEIRMYFVDAAESRDKPYADHRARVTKQGNYFGGLDYKTTLKLGQKAKEFAGSRLQGKNLTVYTAWEEVYDSGRYYSYVDVEGQGFWHETLIKEGLARIYTKGEETPDGTSRKKRENQLRSLEASARKAKRGAWGM
jgi:endonuclease YncB( thermonuclease family)